MWKFIVQVSKVKYGRQLIELLTYTFLMLPNAGTVAYNFDLLFVVNIFLICIKVFVTR